MDRAVLAGGAPGSGPPEGPAGPPRPGPSVWASRVGPRLPEGCRPATVSLPPGRLSAQQELGPGPNASPTWQSASPGHSRDQAPGAAMQAQASCGGGRAAWPGPPLPCPHVLLAASGAGRPAPALGPSSRAGRREKRQVRAHPPSQLSLRGSCWGRSGGGEPHPAGPVAMGFLRLSGKESLSRLPESVTERNAPSAVSQGPL